MMRNGKAGAASYYPHFLLSQGGKERRLEVLAEGANILRLLKHAKTSEQEKGGEGDVILKYGCRKCISC